MHYFYCNCFFFFNDTATTEIYTLSLHDALPISERVDRRRGLRAVGLEARDVGGAGERVVDERARDELAVLVVVRSEEHTSELQSRQYLVCRLLLEKKKNICTQHILIYTLCRRRT